MLLEYEDISNERPPLSPRLRDVTNLSYTVEKEMTAHSIILAGEFHGQRSLVGYSPWTHKESDMAEQLTHTTLYIETNNSRLDKMR